MLHLLHHCKQDIFKRYKSNMNQFKSSSLHHILWVLTWRIFCMFATKLICLFKYGFCLFLTEWQSDKLALGKRLNKRRDVVWFLPVMYMCDCRRPITKDPRLDVHWLCFGVRYGHVYNPLQAFTFINCHGERKQKTQFVKKNIKTAYF